MRIIAELETPDRGRGLLEGQDATDLEPDKRDVNTVFQNYALFSHMNGEQNIRYSLKLRKVPKADIRKRVKKMLEMVRLEGYEKRMPGELSGVVLTFVPGMGLFFIGDILGGNKAALVGNLIQEQLMKAHNRPFAAALSV